MRRTSYLAPLNRFIAVTSEDVDPVGIEKTLPKPEILGNSLLATLAAWETKLLISFKDWWEYKGHDLKFTNDDMGQFIRYSTDFGPRPFDYYNEQILGYQ